jgi:hypothetical protein
MHIPTPFHVRLPFEFATTVAFDDTVINISRDGFTRLNVVVSELGQRIGSFVTTVDERPEFALVTADKWLADRLQFVWGLVCRAMVTAADWSDSPILGPQPVAFVIENAKQPDVIPGEAVVTWTDGTSERVQIECRCADRAELVVNGFEVGYFTRHMGLRWYTSVVQSLHIEARSGLIQRAQLWRLQNPMRAWDTDSCS